MCDSVLSLSTAVRTKIVGDFYHFKWRPQSRNNSKNKAKNDTKNERKSRPSQVGRIKWQFSVLFRSLFFLLAALPLLRRPHYTLALLLRSYARICIIIYYARIPRIQVFPHPCPILIPLSLPFPFPFPFHSTFLWLISMRRDVGDKKTLL